MKLIYTLVFIFLFQFTSTCFGSEPKNDVPISVWGIGTKSCGYWTENRRDNLFSNQLMQWALGYITAYNEYHETNQKTPPDVEAVMASIDKICAQFPDTRITGALLVYTGYHLPAPQK